MVHYFEFDGVHYLYDSESGALHRCDEQVAESVKRINGGEYSANILDEETFGEIKKEIEALKEKGLLYKKEQTAAPVKSGLVKALCLHVSHDCNLSCEYCFAGKGKYRGKSEYMNKETAFRAVDFLIENSGGRKILEIDFFGGEPLLNLGVVKDTVEYAKTRAKEKDKTFLFTLTTNGLLLDEETARYLNAEMENVVLSVDGKKETHDAVRKTKNGCGSYGYIIENVKNFVKIRGDRNYYIRGTFTAKNTAFTEDVLSLADNGLTRISLEPVVTDESSPLYIGEELLGGIKEEYRKLARAYLQRRKDGVGAFGFFHFDIDLENGVCLNKRVSACGAGNEYFSVTPNGDLYPCHQFAGKTEFIMGNVYGGRINPKIREVFRNANLFTKPDCKDCFAKYHCSGGCAANNILYSGDINKPYKVTCGLMKARMECALHVYSELKGE